jgi:1-phosphofructokinase
MVLKDLGRDVGLTGWLGEGNQQSFVSLFEERALADHFVRVAGDTRINVKISEQSGRVTDLNLPGLAVQEGDVSALKRRWSDWLPTLTGSCWRAACPKGGPRLLRPSDPSAQGQGQAGDLRLQRRGVERRDQGGADLVKPNLEELSQWAGRPVKTLSEQAECARAAGQRSPTW